MTTINSQDLIISLIRDSLINFKLVSSLNTIGLNADDYHIHSGDTVFKLMGLQNHQKGDLLFETIYMANVQKVRHISFPAFREELDALSNEIYNELLFAKELHEQC